MPRQSCRRLMASTTIILSLVAWRGSSVGTLHERGDPLVAVYDDAVPDELMGALKRNFEALRSATPFSAADLRNRQAPKAWLDWPPRAIKEKKGRASSSSSGQNDLLVAWIRFLIRSVPELRRHAPYKAVDYWLQDHPHERPMWFHYDIGMSVSSGVAVHPTFSALVYLQDGAPVLMMPHTMRCVEEMPNNGLQGCLAETMVQERNGFEYDRPIEQDASTPEGLAALRQSYLVKPKARSIMVFDGALLHGPLPHPGKKKSSSIRRRRSRSSSSSSSDANSGGDGDGGGSDGGGGGVSGERRELIGIHFWKAKPDFGGQANHYEPGAVRYFLRDDDDDDDHDDGEDGKSSRSSSSSSTSSNNKREAPPELRPRLLAPDDPAIQSPLLLSSTPVASHETVEAFTAAGGVVATGAGAGASDLSDDLHAMVERVEVVVKKSPLTAPHDVVTLPLLLHRTRLHACDFCRASNAIVQVGPELSRQSNSNSNNNNNGGARLSSNSADAPAAVSRRKQAVRSRRKHPTSSSQSQSQIAAAAAAAAAATDGDGDGTPKATIRGDRSGSGSSGRSRLKTEAARDPSFDPAQEAGSKKRKNSNNINSRRSRQPIEPQSIGEVEMKRRERVEEF